MALAIRRKYSLTGRLTVTLIAIFALIAQPMYGLATSQVAKAAPFGTDIIRAAALNGWSTGESGSGGTTSFVDDVTAPYGQGALEMQTNSTNPSRAQLLKSVSVNLADVTNLAYSTKFISGPNHAGVSLQVTINNLSGVPASSSTTLVYEPYWNGTVDTSGAWQNWNTLSGGKFWSSKTIASTEFVNGSGGEPFYTIAGVLANHPNAKITGIKLNIGTYNPSWIVRADGVRLNSTIYDFEPVAPQPPAVPGNLRLNGSFACGYSTSVNYITPTWDAATDAVSYNYKVELPNGAVYGPTNVGNVTSVSGAFGGEGTSKFSVQAVAANGLTSDWAPMCAVTYDKTAPAMPLHETPVNNAVQNSNDFWFDWNDVAGASSYEMQNSTDPAIDANGSFQNVMWTGDYQQIQPTESRARSVGANGTWYWQVRAVDAAGNKSAWTTPWKVTIDKDTPAVPTNLQWTTSSGTIIPDGGTTNDANGVASWNASGGSDIAHYVYKYWNDIEGNQYKPGSEYQVELGSTSLPGVFNQGQGVHHYCVEAVDYAGNTSSCTQFTITYDSTPPALTLNSVPNNSGTSRTISGTSEPFAIVEVTVHSTPQIKTTTADGSGNWSLVFEGLEVGDHTVKVVSTDLGGNVSEQISAFTVLALTPLVQFFISPTLAVTPTDQPFSQGFIGNNPSSAVITESDDVVALSDTSVSDDSVVLSAQDDETGTPLEDTEVLGMMDDKFFGLVWYWWLIVLAAFVGGWLLIAAAIRRNRTQE